MNILRNQPIKETEVKVIQFYQNVICQKIRKLEWQVNQNVVTIKAFKSEKKTLINMHNDVVDKYNELQEKHTKR